MKSQRLVLEVEGGAAGVELPRAGVLTVGSLEGRADVVVKAAGVADVHCAIGRVKGKNVWALKDLGSPGGTRLNGEPVSSARIAAGDRIELGDARLRVVDTAAEKPKGEPAPAPPELTRTAVQAVRSVQGYKIEKPLGRGGMGQVFLAVQESLQRKVALKVLAERFSADQDFVRRFQAEARAAAALNHPNVVTVHDVWEENGRHFLSMEYMDQGTLEGKLARAGRLSAAETLDVLSDAAKGLVFAELRGIVHRDIKPANLMINEVGTIKIADLGLATHLEAEATEDESGKIFGTPHFISPEQARGERVDGRSDLYSLGATAYRLLSGRTPFEGATTREILRGHLSEAPRPLKELVPELPQGLSDLVAKLLEKRPEDRFSSAGALLQEIERLKSQLLLGVGDAQPRPAGGARRWLVPVLVLLVAGGAAGAWFVLGADEGDEQDVHAMGQGPLQALPSGAGAEPANDPVHGGESAPPEPEPAPVPVDDDAALERLELDAQRAHEALSQSLDPAARAEALRALAREFAGTTQAALFEGEAEGLEHALAAEARLASEASERNARALGALRAAAGLEDPERSLSGVLQALAAVEYDPRLDENPAFLARAFEVWRGALERAAARARERLAAGDELARAGRFDDLRASLAAGAADLDERSWPALPAGLVTQAPPELAALRAVAAELDERLAGLHREEHEWNLARLRRDRSVLADALVSAGGLRSELATLDLEAATARLQALAQRVDDEGTRAGIEDLREDLLAARRALDALIDGWQGEGWKRKTLRDPRPSGRANREAAGIDARGVLVKDGGDIQLIPWSAFGESPAELHQLFFERLPREYDAEEARGVATLVRNASVLVAASEASEVLVSDGRSILTEGEALRFVEGFELARGWCRDARALSDLERETEATQALTTCLQAVGDERWSVAQTGLERLLVEHRESLLVRLLSDGRALPALDERMVPPAPAPYVPPPAERDGDDDGQDAPALDEGGR